MLFKLPDQKYFINVSELQKYTKLLKDLGYAEVPNDDPAYKMKLHSFTLNGKIYCQMTFTPLKDKFYLNVVPLEIDENCDLRIKTFGSTENELGSFYYNLVHTEQELYEECYNQQKLLKEHKEKLKLYKMRKDFV